MKVIIILAAIAFTHGAKLERTYLPPSNARTAGGSGSFLQTPNAAPSSATYTQNGNGRSQSGNGFFQTENTFSQPGNGFSQSGNDFSQSENGFSQPGNDFSRSESGFAKSVNGFNNFGAEARPERPRAALERNAAILRQDNSNDGETYSYAYETENGIYAEESGVTTNGVEAQGGYSYTGDDGQVYSVRYTADQNGFVPQGDHLPTPPPVPEEILKALEQNARDEAAGIYDDGSYNQGNAGTDNSYNYYNQNTNAYNGNDDDTLVTNPAFVRAGNAPAYNPFNGPRAKNAPGFDRPADNTPAYNAPIGNAPTFRGAVNNAPSFNSPANNAPSFNSPAYTAPASNAPTFRGPANNAPSFNAPANNAPSFNSPAINVPSLTAPANNAEAFNTPNVPSRNSPSARNLGIEKAYLPPQADQIFGRRQQSFDERTGYSY